MDSMSGNSIGKFVNNIVMYAKAEEWKEMEIKECRESVKKE